MKRIIASVLAVSAIAAAAPALAQEIVPDDGYTYKDDYGAKDASGYQDDYAYGRDGYRGYGRWQGFGDRIDGLDRRIDDGERTGDITRSEAVRLRDDLRDIARTEARYSRSDGLSGWERDDLDARLDRLDVRVSRERRDMQHY
jgi:hypothetical protein